MRLYLIGSLRNPRIPVIASALREVGVNVFDDWFAAGPEADDHWQAYEQARGRTYKEAIQGFAAQHVYEFDLHHLGRCDAAMLVLPAGKSAHLELGYMAGRGKYTAVLFDTSLEKVERWDVMYQFAASLFFSLEEAVSALAKHRYSEAVFTDGHADAEWHPGDLPR